MSNRSVPDLVIALFIILVVLASGRDIFDDLSEGVDAIHLVQELVVLLFGVATLLWLALDRYRKKLEINSLHAQLEEAKHLPALRSAEILAAKQKLAKVVAQQFEDWKLTESERDVGQLLLKGFSLKEIALLRGTTEKTIRQQASSIYQKSGVSGRHAFSAWFLEDLL